MFDLDLIEKDWKENSFRLSEEEIIEIYRSEGATLSKYEEELDEYMKKVNSYCRTKLSAEERLLRAIYGDRETKEEREKRQKMIDSIPEPKKKHLSKESQRKVVEGSLYLVFDDTHNWYDFFEGKIPLEKIYYLCLEALINSVKYMVHCEDPVFSLYVLKSMEQNVIKYVAQYMHITYREAYKMVYYRYLNEELTKKLKFFSENKIVEEPEKPSKIFYRLKDETYDEEYVKRLSSEEFMVDYNNALNSLDEIAKIVMKLSFDINGYRGLTNKEIAEYVGIEVQQVSNVRKKAIKKLRNDARLKVYLD